MKRFLTFILCLAMLVAFTSGCAQNTQTTNTTGDANSTSAIETTAEKAGKTHLKLFTGKIETVDVINDVINSFNASQDQIVVEQEYQKDASNIIKIKFASGEVPDIMTTYEQEYVDAGKYLELSDMSDWWNRLIPSMKDSCTDLKTAKQYRVCTNMTMAGFFYNKEIYKELNLNVATTWDEFVSNLEAIKKAKPNVVPWFIFGKEAWHLGHLIEFIPHGYLKEKYGVLAIKTAMLNNDQNILDFGAANGSMATFGKDMLELKEKGLINSDVLTATSDNCVQAFTSGDAAMFSNGMWVLSSLMAANPEMADKIGFAPYPSYMPDGKPVVLVAEDSGYCISATTESADQAKIFLNYLFKAENQKLYSEKLGSPSAFTDVNAEWAPASIVSDVNAAVKSAANIGFTNEKPSGFSGDDAGRMVQDLLAGKYTAEQFATAYKAAWDAGIK